ncbi:DUF4282 domain-containing protein [Brevibacterium sp. ZH18]|uniref:DUF4282 domain-containing protein n=1 Tax=Brevibacterium sp. ZH18 TaxID=2927784 RepID=UPI001F603968|nr:DUF4282 domain-containing protein [Brevibacterium sp. ZH18]MCI4010619.1 DUF4282 domain-containing protein [Brevibacterium sp. ZH18]
MSTPQNPNFDSDAENNQNTTPDQGISGDHLAAEEQHVSPDFDAPDEHIHPDSPQAQDQSGLGDSGLGDSGLGASGQGDQGQGDTRRFDSDQSYAGSAQYGQGAQFSQPEQTAQYDQGSQQGYAQNHQSGQYDQNQAYSQYPQGDFAGSQNPQAAYAGSQNPQAGYAGSQNPQTGYGQPAAYNQQGHYGQPGQQGHYGQPGQHAGAPQPGTHQGSGFFKSLFDFRFDNFIAIRWAGFIYIIVIVVAGLSWLATIVASIAAGAAAGAANSYMVGGPSFSPWPLILAIIFGWIVPALWVIFVRLALELIVSSVKTAENTKRIADSINR